MSNIETNAATHYGPLFKNWQLKLLGPKPSADQLASVHGLGCRPGKQALAIAMSTRDCGVTGSQIVMACGAPQLNKMRGLIADALLREMPAPLADNGHKVYRNEVTPKGKQRIERVAKAEAAKVAAGAAEADTLARREKSKPDSTVKAKKPASKARKPKAGHVTPVPALEPLIHDNDERQADGSISHENGATADQLPTPQL